MTTESQSPAPSWGRSQAFLSIPDDALTLTEDLLADRVAILDALARYSWTYDERQVTALSNGFSHDAVWEGSVAGDLQIDPIQGREAISSWLQEHMASQSDQRRHNMSNHTFITQTVQNAEVISYLLLTSASRGETKLITTGFYRTRLEKDGSGHWLISHMFAGFDAPF